MPELPEVETIVRGLRATLPQRRILLVRLGKTDFVDNPAEIERELPGRTIAAVERVGKFIRLRLDSQNRAAAAHLFVHLGMTGRLYTQAGDAPALQHTHAFFVLDDGRELRYVDPRRFGRMAYVTGGALEQFQSNLGAEPLEISLPAFRALLAGRDAMIKALLLNQQALRGIGNIYADESLWRARVHPKRLASSLRHDEAGRLHAAIRKILADAIRLGGSTISDFVDAEGAPGEFQWKHKAYGREGKRCYRCGRKIRRIIVAGRSTHYCPQCQRAPRR